MKTKLIKTENYLLLIDEEAKVKDYKYFIDLSVNKVFEFLKIGSFQNAFMNMSVGVILSKDNRHNPFDCKKVISYYPLTKEAKELDLPLLPNPFEEEIIQSLSTQQLPKEFIPEYEEEHHHTKWGLRITKRLKQ